MEGIRNTDIMLYSFGFPYISVKSGMPNKFQFQNKNYSYNSILATQTTSPSLFTFALDMQAIFIRFQPWALYNLTGRSAQKITEEYWDLSVIDNGLSEELMKILYSEESPEYKGDQTENLILSIIKDHKIDSRIETSISYIKGKSGIINIAELASHVNVSIRRLQQLFAKYVGVSPKKMASIYRLHKVIHDVMLKKYPSSNYQYHYDQAHFINDFKRMTGMSFSFFKESIFTPQEVEATLRLNLYRE
jgi:AraC-like DNA-binding protein